MLEGRSRPLGFFSQPISQMHRFRANAHHPGMMFPRNRLAVFPSDATVMDMLSHSLDSDVAGYPRIWVGNVYEVMEEAAQGPYGTFFGFLHGGIDRQWPISKPAETARDIALYHILSELPPLELAIVTSVFGIRDGVVRTYDDVASRLGIDATSVRKKLFEVRRNNQPAVNQLRLFSALDRHSVLFQLSDNTCLFDTRHSTAYGKRVDEVGLFQELIPQFQQYFSHHYWYPEGMTFLDMLSHLRPSMFSETALHYLFSCMKQTGLTDWEEIPKRVLLQAGKDEHYPVYD